MRQEVIFFLQSTSSDQLITWPQLFVAGASVGASAAANAGNSNLPDAGGSGGIINMEDDFDVEQDGAGESSMTMSEFCDCEDVVSLCSQSPERAPLTT